MAAGTPTSCTEFVLEELECTICFDLSISPIYNCVTGHIICGVCIEQLDKCGHCQEPLFQSPLAERLAKKHNVQIACRNSDSGCELIIKSWEMRDHLSVCEYRPIVCRNSGSGCELIIKSCEMRKHFSVCEYRPIRCFENSVTSCGGKICSLGEFSQHLISDHACTIAEVESTDIFQSTSSMQNLDFLLLEIKPVTILKFDDKIYLVHAAFQNGIVYRWITVVGGKREANAYNYTMKISANEENEVELQNNFTWTLPVLPLHQYADFLNVMECGQFASIHWKSLETVCSERVRSDGSKFKYSWSTDITFSKKCTK